MPGPGGNPSGTPRHDGRNDLAGGGRTQQRRNQARTRLTQNATSNVELMDTGQANQLQAQLQQAQQDYLRSTQAAQQIYPGAQEAMAGVERPQFGRIGNDFDQALGTIQGLFGGDQAAPYMSPGEGAAGMGLGNAYGEAGHTMLANAAEREGMFRSSAERQAGLAGSQAQDTLLQQMQDTVQGYNNQMGQLRADDPWQIQNESTRLWEQQQQAKALAAKTKSDAAFSAWLQGQASGLADGSNRPGNPPHDGRNDLGPNHPGGTGGPDATGGVVAQPDRNPGNPGFAPPQGTARGGAWAPRHNPIPPAWKQADSWTNLPPILREMYDRPQGTSRRDVFAETSHPSYSGPGAYSGFINDYMKFRPTLNKLHRQAQSHLGLGGGQ